MKYLKKLMVVALFMLVSFSGKIAAYTFRIYNETGRDVQVRLHWGHWRPLHEYKFIKNGRMRKFSWRFPNSKFGLCLSGIKVKVKKESGKWGKAKKARWKYSTVSPCRDRRLRLTLGSGDSDVVIDRKI